MRYIFLIIFILIATYLLMPKKEKIYVCPEPKEYSYITTRDGSTIKCDIINNELSNCNQVTDSIWK
jgi:hypothetical protein